MFENYNNTETCLNLVKFKLKYDNIDEAEDLIYNIISEAHG